PEFVLALVPWVAQDAAPVGTLRALSAQRTTGAGRSGVKHVGLRLGGSLAASRRCEQSSCGAAIAFELQVKDELRLGKGLLRGLVPTLRALRTPLWTEKLDTALLHPLDDVVGEESSICQDLVYLRLRGALRRSLDLRLSTCYFIFALLGRLVTLRRCHGRCFGRDREITIQDRLILRRGHGRCFGRDRETTIQGRLTL